MQYPVLYQGVEAEIAQKAIIALHGRGGTAKNISELALDLSDSTFCIAAPQAPNNSWYPYSFLKEESLNEPWLSQSVNEILELIEQFSKTIPKNHIFLLGFSQGACMALEVAARKPDRFGGVIAFTGGFIGAKIDPQKYQGNFQRTPIFIGNSDQDTHVPEERTSETKIILERLGANVLYKVYPNMAHTINQDEISIARKILAKGEL